jgi:hypothetical protein
MRWSGMGFFRAILLILAAVAITGCSCLPTGGTSGLLADQAKNETVSSGKTTKLGDPISQ